MPKPTANTGHGEKFSLDNSPWPKAVNHCEKQRLPYVLLTVLGANGSTPRENGTKMVVSCDNDNDIQCFGTIGGGHLEYQAIAKAAQLLASKKPQQHIEHYPLGAKLGQCCGGSTSVLFEAFIPSAINIVLFGAGHVGQALIRILSDLPCHVDWIDSRENFLTQELPDNVAAITSDSPEAEVKTMSPDSYFIVMTHNHALDYEICRAVLALDNPHYIGLIGSQTKWQRFQMRFEKRLLSADQYQKIHCPIGLEQVSGKLPMEVAVSIAGEIISDYQQSAETRKTRRGIQWRDLKPLSVDLDQHTNDASTNTETVSTTEKTPL
ncbi:MAG: xanthine dehydrogenase accessory protein XdhC [Cellvibrionaceae bacterium]|nr:xanthine dehydrogenase accessory protein XdhC [Cellvibrionaceae bacterium]|tara:strand:- start:10513 stop:11478 length:966 start_codon:yes stop_codon:yes gene_type:complete